MFVVGVLAVQIAIHQKIQNCFMKHLLRGMRCCEGKDGTVSISAFFFIIQQGKVKFHCFQQLSMRLVELSRLIPKITISDFLLLSYEEKG